MTQFYKLNTKNKIHHYFCNSEVVVYIVNSKETLLLSSYMAVIFRCLVTKENNLQYSQEVLIDLCNLDQEVSKEKSIINDTDLHHHFDECLAKLVNLQLIESV